MFVRKSTYEDALESLAAQREVSMGRRRQIEELQKQLMAQQTDLLKVRKALEKKNTFIKEQLIQASDNYLDACKTRDRYAGVVEGFRDKTEALERENQSYIDRISKLEVAGRNAANQLEQVL